MYHLSLALHFCQGEDMIPEPSTISNALRACRRVNDYALAVRYLEALKVC